ncbi:MAG: cytochrome C oxidase subunit IV family protein [Planctomycetota bacterium]|nr:cytochrome C oxidase subunit IV family protein [Planctomycetota bacterium]
MATQHPHASHPVAPFDQTDPHGTGSHASHVIVGPMALRTVLAILLVFTALTVGFAQAEQWAASYFNVSLPGWINIVGAMTIATIKAVLVMAIFMQLRYDNALNTLIMAVTFSALAIFVGMTAIDLLGRDRVYEFKSGQITPGGTGDQVATANGRPMVVAAKERYLGVLRERVIAMHPELADAANAAALDARVQAMYLEHKGIIKHSAHHAHDDDGLNTPNRTRPRTGLSGSLQTDAPAHDDHSHGPASSGH